MSKMGEKVLTGLEWCNVRQACNGCPYRTDDPDDVSCVRRLMTDAMMVIDLHEAFIDSLFRMDDDGK